MSRICAELTKPAYGVLGNHDTVCMVPGLEEMGIRMLLNECETIERDHERIHLVGIDDAHFYRADNIEKAVSGIPSEEFSILLTHTPEIYRQAALADFNLQISAFHLISCASLRFCALGVLQLLLWAYPTRIVGT